MGDVLHRIAENLAGRLHGPLTFRLVLQPVMAIAFALVDGRRDGLAGKPPYFWALLTDPAHRRDMLRSGWKSVGKVFLLAIVLDAAYQVIALRWFYPGEALLVAAILALLPYLVVRGPVNRLWPRKKP